MNLSAERLAELRLLVIEDGIEMNDAELNSAALDILRFALSKSQNLNEEGE